MSVEEMKIEVIDKIIHLKSQDELQEVNDLLNKLNTSSTVINLTKHYDTVREQFGDVLQKLAQ